MDTASIFLVGLVLGFVGGALVFTSTGRGAVSKVTSSTGERLSKAIAGK